MDVFSLSDGSHDFWRAAALLAAHRLDLFGKAAEPRTCEELAAAVKAHTTRLRPLLDALAFEGALARHQGDRFVAALVPTAPNDLPPSGPGLLAEVLESDEPLREPGVLAIPGPALQRFHQHLREAGAEPAKELAAQVAPLIEGLDEPSILDLGAGTGTYAAAFLDLLPGSKAVLVDRPEVLALAGKREGIEHRAGDLFDVDMGSGHAVVLLVNVLHLCGPRDCERLVKRAARALAPGGVLVVKDMFVEPDRSGPASGLYFALNMALYTRRGDVHPVPLMDEWLRAAGLFRSPAHRLDSAPDSVVLLGHRS